MDELMFNEDDLRLALEAQTKKMDAAVDSESEESLKQADTDEWAAALAHHFAVACPELKTADMWMEPPKEVGVDVSRDPMRAIIDPYSEAVRNYPGYRVVVHVPFEGEADVFKLTPSSFNFNPPRSRIKADELVLTIEYPHDHPPDIDATVNGFIATRDRSLAGRRGAVGRSQRLLRAHAPGTELTAPTRTDVAQRLPSLAPTTAKYSTSRRSAAHGATRRLTGRQT